MTFFKRAALSMGLGVVGYIVGIFGGIGLVYLLSSNQHDRSMEAAMTRAFVVGPLTALLFAGIFIFVPMLFLKAFWLPRQNVDQYGQSKEQRERFGLLFSERIFEWEPGNLIHTHHDRADFS